MANSSTRIVIQFLLIWVRTWNIYSHFIVLYKHEPFFVRSCVSHALVFVVQWFHFSPQNNNNHHIQSIKYFQKSRMSWFIHFVCRAIIMYSAPSSIVSSLSLFVLFTIVLHYCYSYVYIVIMSKVTKDTAHSIT